jgi:hypothetical protein
VGFSFLAVVLKQCAAVIFAFHLNLLSCFRLFAKCVPRKPFAVVGDAQFCVNVVALVTQVFDPSGQPETPVLYCIGGCDWAEL